MKQNTDRFFSYFNRNNTGFFQRRCLLCDGSSDELHGGLCPGCIADLPWINTQCKTCGLPLPEAADQLQCGECLTTESPFHLAITPLLYQPPLSGLITGFKHHHRLNHGVLFGQLLAKEIRDHYLDDKLPGLIIPVPLHWQRFLWRGFNQSAELGRHLGQELSISCRLDLLQRRRKTPSQQGLSREKRLRNLKGAFQINNVNKKQIIGRRIALLDDVVTTGATASEIASLLLQNGAQEIHLWAIARTPL